MEKISTKKNINRRRAFRIYDQMQIFYSKIDQKNVTEPHPPFDTFLNKFSMPGEIGPSGQTRKKALPDAMPPGPELKEHDTLNVNISASGIAFSCEDRFNEGDYLLIRLVLAGMEVIITYCRVVYCKNSNPYENTYPYWVGAHFINVQEKDREVLVKHVDKKKKQQFIVNGLIGVLVMTVLAFPGEVFRLFLSMLHHLFAAFLHLSHLGFESVEFGIDLLAEHLFHTPLHQTQVITFYILLFLGLLAIYLLWRVLPPFCQRCKSNQIAYWSRKKASLLYYWGEQSSFNKIKIVLIGIVAVTCYGYLAS
jgi:hypothetical protein